MSYRIYDDGDDWDADDFNMFASQGIARFPDATARSAAIASPVVGQYSDVGNGLERWSGSAWVRMVPLPPGGTTGQVLAKASGTDYDVEWVTP